MHDEKKVEEISNEVPLIDRVVAELKAENVAVNDMMFFYLVNIAGLAPGEYQKLTPEEQTRRWDLLFSLPQAEAGE
jgi:hypothetical protein